MSEEGKQAVATLLTGDNFKKIAALMDDNDTLTLEEAQKVQTSLNDSGDPFKRLFVGQQREDMIKALTYATTNGHFEQLAGIDGDKATISKTELEQVAKETGVETGSTPPGGEPFKLNGNNFVKVTDVLKSNLQGTNLTSDQISQIKQYAFDHKDNPEALVQLNTIGELAFADERKYEEYKGIKIDITGTTELGGVKPSEIRRMKETIDLLEKAPDDKKLLENWVKQVGTFVNEETPGAGATNAGGHVTISNDVLANPDIGDTVQTIGHELVHSVPNQGDKNGVTGEELATDLGMMIRFRQMGAFEYTDNYTGETTTFDGTTENLQRKYNGLMKKYFKEHPEDFQKFKNGELSANGLMDALNALGITSLNGLNTFDEENLDSE